MHDVPTTRAAHIISFCDILREIGTPVERALARAKLPVLIEEMPDAMVNNIFATEFAAQCATAEGIEDLGWMGAKAFSSSQMNTDLVSALRSEVSVKKRLEKFFELSAFEDSHLRTGFGFCNGSVQVIGDMDLPEGVQGRDISDWIQVACLIEVVRSVAGADWSPTRISFASDVRVSEAARTAFPNTRFETRAANTSILFPMEQLALSAASARKAPVNHHAKSVEGLDLLRLLIRPYLPASTLPIDQAAELIGTSRRSLQRRLKSENVSYPGLLESVRFEMAEELLRDPDLRLIEVAQAVGFEDQSNFGRSFRRVAGISPGRYRRGISSGEIARL